MKDGPECYLETDWSSQTDRVTEGPLLDLYIDLVNAAARIIKGQEVTKYYEGDVPEGSDGSEMTENIFSMKSKDS